MMIMNRTKEDSFFYFSLIMLHDCVPKKGGSNSRSSSERTRTSLRIKGTNRARTGDEDDVHTDRDTHTHTRAHRHTRSAIVARKERREEIAACHFLSLILCWVYVDLILSFSSIYSRTHSYYFCSDPPSELNQWPIQPMLCPLRQPPPPRVSQSIDGLRSMAVTCTHDVV